MRVHLTIKPILEKHGEQQKSAASRNFLTNQVSNPLSAAMVLAPLTSLSGKAIRSPQAGEALDPGVFPLWRRGFFLPVTFIRLPTKR